MRQRDIKKYPSQSIQHINSVYAYSYDLAQYNWIKWQDKVMALCQQFERVYMNIYSNLLLLPNQRQYTLQTNQPSHPTMDTQPLHLQHHNNTNNIHTTHHHIDSDEEAEDLFNQIQLEVHPSQLQHSHPHFQRQLQNNQYQPNILQKQSQENNQKKTINKMKKHRVLELDSENQYGQANHKKEESKQKQQNDITKVKSSTKLDKKQRKRLKKQKKMRKKMAKIQNQKKDRKQGKQKFSRLKKLKQNGENQNQNEGQQKQGKSQLDKQKQSQKWSGQSSQSQSQQSDASSDSLLNKLNPRKRKQPYSEKKIKHTQQKQGFSLKELGNDGQNNYDNENDISDDDSEYGRKGKNKKRGKDKQKKEVKTNQQMLKSLLQIGLCVGSEEHQQNKRQDYEVDNGLEQVYNMKNSKKKGPKIANKLFADIQIKQDEQKKDEAPKQIQLQVKPRVAQGPSTMTSSFLNKTQKLKKVRGMQSELKQQQYQKIQSLKAKQSMLKLINQKQLQQAEQILLDVKIPQVIKGRQQINNSIFLKKVSSTTAPIVAPTTSGPQVSQNQAVPAPFVMPAIQRYGQYHSNSGKKQKQSLIINDKQRLKVSRLDFFKSMTQQVKARKSRDISDQAIKNTFKITNLQQIQQMRKINEQKKRKQNLRQFDEQDEDDDQDYEGQIPQIDQQIGLNKIVNQKNIENEQAIVPNKLREIMFKIEIQNSNKVVADQKQIINNEQREEGVFEQNPQIVQQNNEQHDNKAVVQAKSGNRIQQQVVQQQPKCKQIAIQVKKSKLSQQQYRKLLQMQEKQMQEQQGENDLQLDEQSDHQMQQEEQDNSEQLRNKMDADLNKMELQYNHDAEQQDNDNDKLLQLEQSEEHHNNAEKVDIQVDIQVSNSYQQSELSQQEVPPNLNMTEQDHNYAQYLKQLEQEGINIKKNAHQTNNHHKNHTHAIINNKPQATSALVVNDQKQNHQIAENSNTNGNRVIGHQQQRKQFHKLRKLANILKQKRRKFAHIRKAGEFYDEEAEEGSDNQEHDRLAKQINYDQQAKEYQGVDLDADLQQFLDNVVDLNQDNEDQAFRKYLEDVQMQDREELKRIMRGDFKRRRDGQPIIEQMEEDQKQRLRRMQQFQEYMKKKQMEDGKDLYMQEQANKSNQDSEDDGNSDSQQNQKNQNKKQAKVQYELEQVDQINEQNLARYFDDQYVDNKRVTTIIKRPIIDLPTSYQRSKKTELRNSLKSKEAVPDANAPTMKLKKTSSHLNEMIMKNKQKIKPNVFIKNFALLNKR